MLRTIGIAFAILSISWVASTGARAEDAPPKVVPAECRKIDRCIPTREILDRSGGLDGKVVLDDKAALDDKSVLDKTWIRLDTEKSPLTDVR
ncbi:hypothetical protein [Kaistia terrae]|uniref:Uncharacterized protein n=1 Tax=Kaistia terrae TaxID=537017 RepID=A0ABW0PYE6_9HYPH|nr:hypothetical protein [Kaistia terrae]MCX5580857.1 hypothetical protein [Kaistia terrae]